MYLGCVAAVGVHYYYCTPRARMMMSRASVMRWKFSSASWRAASP